MKKLDSPLKQRKKSGEVISIYELLMALARQIKTILSIFFCIPILTIFYLFFISTPEYKSTSKFISSSNSSGNSSSLASQFGISIPIINSETKWAYAEVLRSRTLAKKLLTSKFDTKKYGKQIPLLQILNKGRTLPVSAEIISNGVDELLRSTNIVENKKTGIFTLSVFTFEPKLSKQINEAMLFELDNHQKEYNKNRTTTTRLFIEGRIVETEKELMMAEEKLKKFTESNRRIENSPSLLLAQQRLSREVSVLTSVFTSLKEQLETTKIEDVKESDYIILIDEPEEPAYPKKPSKKTILLFFSILGLILSIIVAFFKDYIDFMSKDEKNKYYKVKLVLFEKIRSIF